MDGDRAHPEQNASRFPVEVCENIIDMLYTAWRVRSQCNLFYTVVLHDLAALHTFSAVLDNGPHLCEYVHEVTFVGRTLRQNHTSNSETTKILQYLPLHPRFSLFFSTFTTVSGLYIMDITSGHFNDFPKIINSLPALRTLAWEGVRCVALGALPFSMKPRANGIHAPGKPFASNLGELSLVHMDIHCVQRLVSACGPRLRGLTVAMPFFHHTEMVLLGYPTTEHSGGVDLSLCSTLDRVDIFLEPESVTDGQTLDQFKAMLNSWGSDVPLQNVHLRAYYEHKFARQAFADLLGTAGRVLEALVIDSSAPPCADGEVGEQSRRWEIWIDLYDWEVWRDWWRTHVQKCFLTLGKSAEFRMNFNPPPYDLYKWKDSHALPPMLTTTT
ncbi:hypothetical protein BD309DRAFT_994865 [Dichomitus squalens]|nr:hypothetical protein BD309DRAFT_994865 [Dichomitus squalens]